MQRVVGAKEKRREKEEKEREKKRKHVAPWDLLGIVEGVVWFVARRSRAPPFSPPFPSSRPFPTRHLCPFLLSEGERGTFPWGGLARVCHSVMDDSTPTRSIRLPCVYMPRGEGETHPPAFLPPLCRESRRFQPI